LHVSHHEQILCFNVDLNSVRPCDHQFCNVCIRKLEDGHGASREQVKQWKCPTCGSDVSHVAGFSAPMNLPGEEALKVKVPVHVLKIEDGRVRFKSINKTRI
jgi:Zinc finger, C3HC4 type (RING finger)